MKKLIKQLKTFVMLAGIMSIVFVGCGSEVSHAQKLIEQKLKTIEVQKVIFEEDYTLNSGKYTVLKTTGKWTVNNEEKLILYVVYKKDSENKLVGYYAESKSFTFADGIVISENGSVTVYTDWHETRF